MTKQFQTRGYIGITDMETTDDKIERIKIELTQWEKFPDTEEVIAVREKLNGLLNECLMLKALQELKQFTNSL